MVDLEGECRCPTAKKKLGQENSRLKRQVIAWKSKYSAEKRSANDEKKRLKTSLTRDKELSRLRSQVTSTRCYYKKQLEEKVNEHKMREEELNKTVLYLENRVAELEEEREELKKDEQTIQTKVSGRYSDSMRMAVYQMAERGCPVDHAGSIVGAITEEVSGKKLSHLPSAATVSRMVREMGSVANLQSAEALLKSKKSTLCWDGTELSGAHISESHAAVIGEKGREYYVLSVADMPGGKTEDYLTHLQVCY